MNLITFEHQCDQKKNDNKTLNIGFVSVCGDGYHMSTRRRQRSRIWGDNVG